MVGGEQAGVRPRSGRRAQHDRGEGRLLDLLAGGDLTVEAGPEAGTARVHRADLRRTRCQSATIDDLLAAGCAAWRWDGGTRRLAITEAGRAKRARRAAGAEPFRAQHGGLSEEVLADEGRVVLFNDGESPLVWLHRRRGADGAPLISAVQFAAGERLRSDLTRAQILPRVTANWSSAVASGRRSAEGGNEADATIAARQRVRRALDAAGSEFAGLLIDVCGFLKRLPDIERERGWPARSARLVLDMALSRLARHYGYADEARGPDQSTGLRSWGAEGYRPAMGA